MIVTLVFLSTGVRAGTVSEDSSLSEELPNYSSPAFHLESPTTSPSSSSSDRGRNLWSLTFDTGAFYGFTDKERLFFTVPVNDIQQAGASAMLGLEGNLPGHFSVRMRAGFQRLFYSNIGIQQIQKNFLVGDLLFSYYFVNHVNRWDPYFTVGPSLIWGDLAYQVYLTTGFGTRYFFNDNWSLRIEPLVVTEFKGLRTQLNLGVSYHF